MQAQQVIHLGLLDAVDHKGAYSTFLTAFGRKDLADKARAAALERYVDWKIANHANKK